MDITFRSDMDVELVNSMGSDLSVAQAAWVSTQGAAVEDFAAGNTERAEGLIRFLMRGRHGTPFEHNSHDVPRAGTDLRLARAPPPQNWIFVQRGER